MRLWCRALYKALLVSLIFSIPAYSGPCKNLLTGARGAIAARLENLISKASDDFTYARTIIGFDGNREFLVGSKILDQGIHGVLFELIPLGAPTPSTAKRFPDLVDADGKWKQPLVVKFPHNPKLSVFRNFFRNNIRRRKADEDFLIGFAESMIYNLHPAIKPKIIAYELGEIPFQATLKEESKALTKFKNVEELSSEQLKDLEWLFNTGAAIRAEGRRRLERSIWLNLKPNNLYWDGTHWGLYEVSTTRNLLFYGVPDNFSSYLSLVNGYLAHKK